MKTLIAVCLLVAASTVEAGTHRISVDVTVQDCTRTTCRIVRQRWTGTAVAIGRKDGVEYLLSNQHLFAGGSYVGGRTITVREIHSITVHTFDAGSFAAKLIGVRNSKGVDGVDLAILSVRSSKRWNSYAVADGVPAPLSRVSVEGWPSGRYRQRTATVSGFTRQWGMRTSGIARQGESGGAVLYQGELAGVVWGSRVGLILGTYATPAPDIRRFLAAKLGFVPGSESKGTGTGTIEAAPTPPKSRRPPVPIRSSARCSDCDKRLDAIEKRLVDLQTKLGGIKPADLAGIRADLARLRGLVVPIRIETSDGEIIAERRLELKDVDGKLELAPIVLKFDEKILKRK